VPFLLVRHGSVDYDSHPGRFSGHGIDLLPLVPSGVAEAEKLALCLAEGGDVDLIISSPMARALQTAMILSWELARQVEVDLDLHEWVPDESQQWSTGEVPAFAYQELLEYSGEWPAGEERLWEPHSAVRRRVGGVLDRYDDDRTVVGVCHSGVIEAMTGVANTPPCGVVPYLHA
jgi:broad specificity phosphatase PhoE